MCPQKKLYKEKRVIEKEKKEREKFDKKIDIIDLSFYR